MYKKLIIIVIFLILFFKFVQTYSINKTNLNQDLTVVFINKQNIVAKIGEKEQLSFTIKNLTNYTIKKINIKIESTFTVDDENFMLDELKPNEEHNEMTSFYILNNTNEKKINFIVTYTDLNGNFKKSDFTYNLEIKVDMLDQYLKLVPYGCLFLIFSLTFIISYRVIVNYRKSNLKNNIENKKIHTKY
ncbi:MAG: hypothetical protein FWC47_01875 [Oscillospiraceae bacterium]|nr:hypothetical protein [Oscillospiraceae bacterium]